MMPVSSPSLLPRTPYDSWQAEVDASKTRRLLVAMAEEAAERGYGAVSVAHVLARAGVSRRAFYEQFADKQDCFLAAYDAGVDVMVGELAAAAGAEGVAASERLRGTIERFLTLLAAEPAFARIATVEVLAAGRPGRERYSAAVVRFTALLRALHEQARAEDRRIAPASDVRVEAVGGGINRVITSRVLAGDAARLPELAEELTAFAAAVLLSRKQGP